MNINPYPPPAAPPPQYSTAHLQGGPGARPVVSRTPFILAAVGAWLASAYWATLTLLIGLSLAYGSGSFTAILLPCVLIVLYIVRGAQIFKGDPRAAQRILWLHLIGAGAAVLQMKSGKSGADAVVMVLQGIKIVIHVFGGVAAFFAKRAFERAYALPR